jgi:ABC-type sugar transport system permease subunit
MSDVSLKEGLAVDSSDQPQSDAQKARRWRTDLIGFGFLLPFLIVYVVFLVVPVFSGLRMSFFNWTIGGPGSTQFLGLANYKELFADSDFWQSLWITILFTIISTPVLVIIALGLALLVNRGIPARGLFRTVFFAPFVLPVSVVALIWNWLYQPGFGLINGTISALGLQEVDWLNNSHIALLSVIILTIWWTVGFNFVLYLAGMQQIPRELHEAANIDGAGAWARIRWITIPLLNRFTSLIIILQVIASLQLFSQSYLLQNQTDGPNFSTRSVVQYIYESGFTSFRIGYASALSYIFFILILLVSLGQFALLSRTAREG